MKKTLLIGATLVLATTGWAQKSKIRDARDYLSDKNYKKAIATLNEVIVNEDTKSNPEAWYLRGFTYNMLAIDTTSGVANASDEAYTSLMKVLALKPDYNPEEINRALYTTALLSFNKGVAAYGKGDFENAYQGFNKAAMIYNVNGGHRFGGDKAFTSLALLAKRNAAYAALAAKKDDEAAVLLNDLRMMPGNNDSTIYSSLADIYTRQNKDDQLLSTIEEARKKYPNNRVFRDVELNYYIKTGKQDVLLSKLEAAVASDPNNPDLLFNLGNAYERQAFPKGAPKPANFNEVFGKAESAYTKALAASPDNPLYNYNTGVIYYETASGIISEMQKVTGLTAADQKKYDALLAERNRYFEKAVPYFDKAYKALDARGKAARSADDTETYQNAMIGLREIYSRLDNKDNKAKVEELKAKLDALK